MLLISLDVLRHNDTLNMPLPFRRFPFPIRTVEYAPTCGAEILPVLCSVCAAGLREGRQNPVPCRSVPLTALEETRIYFFMYIKKKSQLNSLQQQLVTPFLLTYLPF